MIKKLSEMRNGYIVDETTTNEEWKELLKSYDKVRCVICNSKTSLHFRVGLLGNNILTINNKLLDDVVYINGVY